MVSDFIGNVLSTIGILTIFKAILYFKMGKDYESITIKRFSVYDENSNIDKIYSNYDIVRCVDLSQYSSQKANSLFLIGPTEKELTELTFFKFFNYYKDIGLVGESILFESEIPPIKPEEYILVKVFSESTIPSFWLDFKIDYKNVRFLFSENMRSGIDDKTTLPTKRTIRSFLAS